MYITNPDIPTVDAVGQTTTQLVDKLRGNITLELVQHRSNTINKKNIVGGKADECENE